MEAADRSFVLRIFGPAEPIEGEARSGDGRARVFSGWIEMVALIDRWQAEDDGLWEDDSESPDRST